MNFDLNDKQLLRYSRHILLNEIGIEGQEKICQSTILVVGCGGLGAAALPYLAASGVGKIFIADDDTIEETNLQRQITYSENDLGCLKSVVMQKFLKNLHPDCEIVAFETRMGQEELAQILPECDVLVDCSDNFDTRFLLNEMAVKFKKPLVSGAAVRFDGQLAVYRADLDDAPCYACLFDEQVNDNGTCATFGVFSPLVGVIGAAQAVETLKILLGKSSPVGILRCYNALSGDWQAFKFTKNKHCRVCAK